jgi:hypothetical protein
LVNEQNRFYSLFIAQSQEKLPLEVRLREPKRGRQRQKGNAERRQVRHGRFNFGGEVRGFHLGLICLCCVMAIIAILRLMWI